MQKRRDDQISTKITKRSASLEKEEWSSGHSVRCTSYRDVLDCRRTVRGHVLLLKVRSPMVDIVLDLVDSLEDAALSVLCEAGLKTTASL